MTETFILLYSYEWDRLVTLELIETNITTLLEDKLDTFSGILADLLCAVMGIIHPRNHITDQGKKNFEDLQSFEV